LASRIGLVLAAFAFTLALARCDGDTSADPHRDFVVDVVGERFVMRTTDPDTIQQAVAILNGAENRFPIGPLLRGNGGFNPPWSWHMDPDQVRLTEVAVEVCDGRPSYVEENLDDFLMPGVGYCPWSGRIVGER
jgi:hypothetical protein